MANMKGEIVVLQQGADCQQSDWESLPSTEFPLYLFPTSFSPYLELARVEKPTGFILVFWPFAWGLTMAAYRTKMPWNEYWWSLLDGVIAAIVLRTSACTVNDIFDRQLDACVARTKKRPLPSGRISVLAAAIYLLIQYATGVIFFLATLQGIALVQLVPHSDKEADEYALGPAFMSLHFSYFHCKAWLGFAMNFGFMTAWTATTGDIDGKLLCVAMAACWCWTILYDTIYACQDIRDDIKMGSKSTAILFGSRIRALLILVASCFIALLVIAGVLNKHGWPFFAISVGGTAAHVAWQFHTVNLDIPESCWENFKRNGHLGWPMWAGLILDYRRWTQS